MNLDGFGDFQKDIPTEKVKVKQPLYNFEPGKRYEIVHQSPGQRYARVSVMVYLGTSGAIDQLSFSARPVAGTQTMPRSWIRNVEEVPDSTAASLNRRADRRHQS
jgi:hypothetical protein